MKKIIIRKTIIYRNSIGMCLIIYMLMFTSSSLSAESNSDIKIEGAWIRALPPTSKTSASYMIIHNLGSVELKPGSYHIMLINLKIVPKIGDHVSVTLI